jgi:hypothetical protein
LRDRAGAIKVRNPLRFTVFARRGFAATCAHSNVSRVRENRRMNAG